MVQGSQRLESLIAVGAGALVVVAGAAQYARIRLSYHLREPGRPWSHHV